MLKREITDAMRHIWNDIAPDLFAACGVTEFSKEDVIDFVLDASRMETSGYLSPAALAHYKSLIGSEVDALADSAFQYEAYCA